MLPLARRSRDTRREEVNTTSAPPLRNTQGMFLPSKNGACLPLCKENHTLGPRNFPSPPDIIRCPPAVLWLDSRLTDGEEPGSTYLDASKNGGDDEQAACAIQAAFRGGVARRETARRRLDRLQREEEAKARTKTKVSRERLGGRAVKAPGEGGGGG